MQSLNTKHNLSGCKKFFEKMKTDRRCWAGGCQGRGRSWYGMSPGEGYSRQGEEAAQEP
jgi:hypothetical protein